MKRRTANVSRLIFARRFKISLDRPEDTAAVARPYAHYAILPTAIHVPLVSPYLQTGIGMVLDVSGGVDLVYNFDSQEVGLIGYAQSTSGINGSGAELGSSHGFSLVWNTTSISAEQGDYGVLKGSGKLGIPGFSDGTTVQFTAATSVDRNLAARMREAGLDYRGTPWSLGITRDTGVGTCPAVLGARQSMLLALKVVPIQADVNQWLAGPICTKP